MNITLKNQSKSKKKKKSVKQIKFNSARAS